MGTMNREFLLAELAAEIRVTERELDVVSGRVRMLRELLGKEEQREHEVCRTLRHLNQAHEGLTPAPQVVTVRTGGDRAEYEVRCRAGGDTRPR